MSQIRGGDARFEGRSSERAQFWQMAGFGLALAAVVALIGATLVTTARASADSNNTPQTAVSATGPLTGESGESNGDPASMDPAVSDCDFATRVVTLDVAQATVEQCTVDGFDATGCMFSNTVTAAPPLADANGDDMIEVGIVGLICPAQVLPPDAPMPSAQECPVGSHLYRPDEISAAHLACTRSGVTADGCEYAFNLEMDPVSGRAILDDPDVLLPVEIVFSSDGFCAPLDNEPGG